VLLLLSAVFLAVHAVDGFCVFVVDVDELGCVLDTFALFDIID
jgi:hypothetical protein